MFGLSQSSPAPKAAIKLVRRDAKDLGAANARVAVQELLDPG
jgi:hypothetical protein